MLINRNRGRPQPANRGVPVTARSAIDRLSRAAQERNINGASVEGFPCQFYSAKTTGLRCTCVGGAVTPPGGGGGVIVPPAPGTVLDTQGNASPAHIQAMLQGSVVKINRYGSRSAQLQGLEATPPVIEPTEIQVTPITNKTTDGATQFSEILEPTDDLDDLFDDGPGGGGNSFLDAQGAEGCGVCLGTGFVGGYNYVNGWRAVYDAQSAWSLQGFSILPSATPNTMSGAAGAVAQLIVVLPAGAKSLRAARLFNDKERVTGYVLELYVDEQWVVADAQSLLAAAVGVAYGLRIRATADLTFTHLELSFELQLSPLYIEWNRMTRSENPRLPENTENISAVIAPNLPQCNVYDIVIDPVYERVWKVTSVTNNQDRQLRVHGWEVQLRLIQQFELPQLLANSTLLHRHSEFTNALVPDADIEDHHVHTDLPTR